MPTLLHPEITKASEPRMVCSFVDDATVLGISHVHDKQTSHLQRHPRINRISDTSVSLTTHHSTHSFRTYPINALNMLLIKQTTEGMTLWNILTHKMLSILITRRNHHSHLPIKPTTSIKLEGLISQVSTRIIVT